MYELPEYKLNQEYFCIRQQNNGQYKVDSFICDKDSGPTKELFNHLCYAGKVFATCELAQIEADRCNARNKLRNLAREREKEFPVNLNGRETKELIVYFIFSLTIDNEAHYIISEYGDLHHADTLYFSGFKSYQQGYDWLESVMSEFEIRALCMPVEYV